MVILGRLLQVVTLLLLLPFSLSFLPLNLSPTAFFALHSATRGEEKDQNYQMVLLSQACFNTFSGKSVLLTGASGGLGSALARQLASCQVEALILSGRKKDELNKIAKECQILSTSTKIHIVTCDLADKESVLKLGEEALELCGTIDVLINNGGVSSRSDFLDTKLEVDERIMQINFFSGASLAKLLVPKMIQNESGKIIWISSVQGLIGIPSRTSYAVSSSLVAASLFENDVF